jgi:UDP-N-acetylmuramate dehydrogenase
MAAGEVEISTGRSSGARMTVAAGNGSPPPAWAVDLAHLPDIDFRWQEPLACHTTFQVGGAVTCLARPNTEQALVELMNWIRAKEIPHFILGGGSNVLAPDLPWQTVAIQLERACGTIEKLPEPTEERAELWFVGAGVRLARLLRFCLKKGLHGLDAVVGIPGTVGGALVMNAGTKAGAIADAMVWISLLDAAGNRLRLQKQQLNVGYRSIQLPPESLVLGAAFRLHAGSRDELRERFRRLMIERKDTQPHGRPSAGCIFKNPPGHSAGALIERVGLKGLRVGNAQVSTRHANWIINLGDARASDIRALIELIERRVEEELGIRLQREVRVLGT